MIASTKKPPDTDYGRCGEHGSHRDHEPDEIERYKRAVKTLCDREVKIQVVESAPSQAAGCGQKRDWSIQIFQNRIADDGSNHRICTIYWCEATDIGSAYADATGHFPDAKLGTILPGRHLQF